MRIRIGYQIAFQCPAPVPKILMLSIHPTRVGDLEAPAKVCFDQDIRIRDYTDHFGNTCIRIVAPPGVLSVSFDAVVHDCGLPDPVVPEAAQSPVDGLPSDTLEFLLASRYCEVDRMSDIAWARFGGVSPGWSRVREICDYVHDRLTFSYANASATRTAWQAHEGGFAVCRDFAHLAITLCRCMNIPARYCTGYLGDIGVPPVPEPMDFSAWFEAYLDDRWYTFDARHNTPRIGRILMASGRDAADVALSTSFGPSRLVKFAVVTEELS